MEHEQRQLHQPSNIYKKSSKLLQLQQTHQHNNKNSIIIKRTFVFDSSDFYIRKILIDHQWQLLPVDSTSSTLKWIYAPKNHSFGELDRNQKINHFPHSQTLTTKLGLKRTLTAEKTGFVDEDGRNHFNFFPRSYDLSEQNQLFVADFKFSAVLNLLKKFMIAIQLESKQLFYALSRKTLSKKDSREANWVEQLNQLLQRNQLYQRQTSQSATHFKVNGQIFESLLLYFAVLFTLDCEVTHLNFPKQQLNELVSYSYLNPPYRNLELHYNSNSNLIRSPSHKSLKLFFELYRLCFATYPWLKPDGLRNIWVIKTSDSSRGRSIFLIQKLQDAKLYNNGTRMIQKYIEDVWIYHSNPSLQSSYPFMAKLDNKKFDIRIWVLVKSFCPLEAYVYQQGYLRISQQQYQLSDIGNEKTHLTNFSVNWKKSKQDSENSYVLLSEFLSFLQGQQAALGQKIKAKIDKIILHCLLSADNCIGRSDSRCFELYGFDIILDGELNPWLLEINMSPACNERGKLAQVLEQMGTELLSIVGLINTDITHPKWKNITTKIPSLSYKKQSFTADNTATQYKQNLNHYQTEKIFKQKISFAKNGIPFQSVQSTDIRNLLPKRPILPSIRNSNVLQSHQSQICNLMIGGTKLKLKSFWNVDHYTNLLQASLTIQNFVRNRKRQIGQCTKNKICLNFLCLFQHLGKLLKKRKRKAFKRLKKLCRPYRRRKT